MGLISRRFKFLENLFPPGGALPPQPGFFEESVSPVHQILNGTDRLGEYFTFTATGGPGTDQIFAGAPDDNKYFYPFAVSGSHDDPVARFVELGFRVGAVDFPISASGIVVPTDIFFTTPRAFINPPRAAIYVKVPALAAAQAVTLRFVYLELDIGEPAPPSP